MLNGRAWELARPSPSSPPRSMFTGASSPSAPPPAVPITPLLVIRIVLGTLMAAVLNAASEHAQPGHRSEADR